MKVVLYNDTDILEVVENCENVKVEGNNVVWHNGSLKEVRLNIAVVDDATDTSTVEAVKSAYLLGYMNVKKKEMSNACANAITSGFTSSTTGHVYEYGEIDQMNIHAKLSYLERNANVATVDWKTEDAGIVSHTRDQIFSLYNEGEEHKSTMLAKYWSLKDQIYACTTIEDIEKIKW